MRKTDKKVLIMIPAYNEAESITKVLVDIRKNVPFVDILIINDGSSDDTEKKVRNEMEKDNRVMLINLPYNLGIGAAVQTGFKYAKEKDYTICVQCDGDGQHPAYQLNKFIETIEKSNVDLVIGSRFRTKYTYTSTFPRLAGIYILSKIVSVITNQKITDPTVGLRAFSRRAIEFFSYIYPADYPEPESLVLAHKRGLKIFELPVRIKRRKHGSSSIGLFRSVYYISKVVLAIIIDFFETIPGDS